MPKSHTTLVTGINGFVGQHMARELKRHGHTVFGTGTAPHLMGGLESYVDNYFGNCDLTKPADVKNLAFEKVGSVINLAGMAQMGSSFVQEKLYMHTNVSVHTNVAERLVSLGSKARVISVSSGAVYGINQDMPLKESSALAPQSSPYSRSKITMEKAMAKYRQKGLDVIIVRPFNHIGPGQGPGFLVPDLTQQMVRYSAITVGNLQTERDYTDVRDVVRAYRLLATSPSLYESTYNVCSGHSVKGEVILELLKTALHKEDAVVRVDKSRFRPNDAPKHFGDSSRVKKDTGWQPTIPLEQTIRDFLVWYVATNC